MSHARARSFRMILFLALFILIDWAIEWTALRPRSLTEALDRVSLASGVDSQIVENVLIGAAAFLALQIVLVLTTSLRFLTGEPPRRVRPPDELTHEHGAADE